VVETLKWTHALNLSQANTRGIRFVPGYIPELVTRPCGMAVSNTGDGVWFSCHLDHCWETCNHCQLLFYKEAEMWLPLKMLED
jgi:hypothetical protein